jgi:hypothetical protein
MEFDRMRVESRRLWRLPSVFTIVDVFLEKWPMFWQSLLEKLAAHPQPHVRENVQGVK